MTAAPVLPSASTAPIPFIDLATQRQRLGDGVLTAIQQVVDSGAFIMGPAVKQLEEELARRSGARHVISCASGTDALMMLLMAKGIGPGDAVLCPSFTFAATAEVVALLGATPVFVDVTEADFNLDPKGLEPAWRAAVAAGLTVRGIMAVDLFGQAADYQAIDAFAQDRGLWVLADAAQSFGAAYHNRQVGSLGTFAATSFYPSKPLGCYGDGGAIFCDDDGLRDVLHSIRVHGQGSDKYENVRLGLTGRMDTIQAAVLLEKLKIFDDEIAARNRVAERYNAALAECATVPLLQPNRTSVWAQYTIQIDQRDAVAEEMKADGVPTMVFYMRPMHTQGFYAKFPQQEGGLPVTERLARRVLCLPMHPYLDPATQDRIIASVHRAVRAVK